MVNYKDYSKDAFLNPKMQAEYKQQGFALYQSKNTPNFLAYATRTGLVHVWTYNEETGEVSINCVTLIDPSKISTGTYVALEQIAKQKHWRGGVHKLHHYLRHIGEERLDKEGIDPYFYAWLVEYGIATDSVVIEVNSYFACFNDILRPSEFTSVVGLANIVGEDPIALAQDFVIAREKNLEGFEDYAHRTLSANKRVQKVRALVDEELPIGATEEMRADLVIDILRLIDNVVEKVTAE